MEEELVGMVCLSMVLCAMVAAVLLRAWRDWNDPWF